MTIADQIQGLPPDAIAQVVNAYRDAYQESWDSFGPQHRGYNSAHAAGCAAFRDALLSVLARAPAEAGTPLNLEQRIADFVQAGGYDEGETWWPDFVRELAISLGAAASPSAGPSPERSAWRPEGSQWQGLLPCPWCGAFPKAMRITGGDAGAEMGRIIVCDNPDCAVQPYLDARRVGGNSANARYRWNTRATGPSPTAAAQLREALERIANWQPSPALSGVSSSKAAAFDYVREVAWAALAGGAAPQEPKEER